jgi:hypothetical protein
LWRDTLKVMRRTQRWRFVAPWWKADQGNKVKAWAMNAAGIIATRYYSTAMLAVGGMVGEG